MKYTIQEERINCGFEPNDESITLDKIAMGSVVPGIYAEPNGTKDGKLKEVIFADGISGGADQVNNMPRQLHLIRMIDIGDGKLEKFDALYVQVGVEPITIKEAIDKNPKEDVK